MSEQSTSNTSNQATDISDRLKHLTDLYNDEEWRKAQDIKLVQGIEVAIAIINNMTNGVSEFLEAFYEFVGKVSNNMLVNIGNDSEGYNAPTQTPANRATRRARTRGK